MSSMTGSESDPARGLVVEEEIHLTLVQLCQASQVPEPEVRAWVLEGLLEPSGGGPAEWRHADSPDGGWPFPRLPPSPARCRGFC